jgi:hypothetical protein
MIKTFIVSISGVLHSLWKSRFLSSKLLFYLNNHFNIFYRQIYLWWIISVCKHGGKASNFIFLKMFSCGIRFKVYSYLFFNHYFKDAAPVSSPSNEKSFVFLILDSLYITCLFYLWFLLKFFSFSLVLINLIIMHVFYCDISFLHLSFSTWGLHSLPFASKLDKFYPYFFKYF